MRRLLCAIGLHRWTVIMSSPPGREKTWEPIPGKVCGICDDCNKIRCWPIGKEPRGLI